MKHKSDNTLLDFLFSHNFTNVVSFSVHETTGLILIYIFLLITKVALASFYES